MSSIITSETSLDAESERVADRIRVVAAHFRIIADEVRQGGEVLGVEGDGQAAELDGVRRGIGEQVGELDVAQFGEPNLLEEEVIGAAGALLAGGQVGADARPVAGLVLHTPDVLDSVDKGVVLFGTAHGSTALGGGVDRMAGRAVEVDHRAEALVGEDVVETEAERRRAPAEEVVVLVVQHTVAVEVHSRHIIESTERAGADNRLGDRT